MSIFGRESILYKKYHIYLNLKWGSLPHQSVWEEKPLVLCSYTKWRVAGSCQGSTSGPEAGSEPESDPQQPSASSTSASLLQLPEGLLEQPGRQKWTQLAPAIQAAAQGHLACTSQKPHTARIVPSQRLPGHFELHAHFLARNCQRKSAHTGRKQLGVTLQWPARNPKYQGRPGHPKC